MLFSLPVPTWQLLVASIQNIPLDFQLLAQCHYFIQHLAEGFFFLTEAAPSQLIASSKLGHIQVTGKEVVRGIDHDHH